MVVQVLGKGRDGLSRKTAAIMSSYRKLEAMESLKGERNGLMVEQMAELERLERCIEKRRCCDYRLQNA